MKHISFRDNIHKMFHILRVVFSVSKGYFFTFLTESLFKSIRPYITIIFTYLILDGLIANNPLNQIMNHVYWMIILTFATEIILYILQFLRTQYVIELQFNLDNKIALKTYELDYAQIENNQTMNLIQQAEDGSNGNGGLPSYCEGILGEILTSSLSIVYGIILLSRMLYKVTLTDPSLIEKFLNSPYSFIIVVIALLIPSFVSRYVMKKDNEKSYGVMMGNIEGNRRASYFFRIASDYKYGKDIRLFGMKDMIIEQMKDQKNSVDNNWRGYIQFNVKMMYITYFANFLLSFVAYSYVGLKAIYGLVSIGNVVSYVASITLVSRSISTLVSRYAKMHLYNNYLNNYFTFLNLKGTQTYGPINNVQTTSLSIEFDQVSFRYPNADKDVLQNLSFTIRNAEKIAIVGPNGAGKTTLVKLLCRMYDVTSGEIRINSIPIQQYTKKALYDLYSIVFQDFKLFSYSIADNIANGGIIDTDNMQTIIKNVGLQEFITKQEKGIHTILYQRNKEAGIEVSGGEAQKIAIARALYKDTPFVILDEPTAALDPKSEAEIYDKFNMLVQNKTSIFISHRMSSTKFCDRIFVLDHGSLTETGNHQSLLHQNGLYSRMWNAQAKYYKD